MKFKLLVMVFVLIGLSSFGFAQYIGYNVEYGHYPGYGATYYPSSNYVPASNYPSYYYQPYQGYSYQNYPSCYNCGYQSSFYYGGYPATYSSSYNYGYPNYGYYGGYGSVGSALSFSGSPYYCKDPSGVEGEVNPLGINPKGEYVCSGGAWRFLRTVPESVIIQFGRYTNKADFYQNYAPQNYVYVTQPYPNYYQTYQNVAYASPSYYSQNYYSQIYPSSSISQPFGNDTYSVEIRNDGYFPQTVSIKKGQRVRWLNIDGPNWPASDVHPTHTNYPGTDNQKCGTGATMFDACKVLERGEVFEFMFNVTGRWYYHNHLNPDMKGVVIVE